MMLLFDKIEKIAYNRKIAGRHHHVTIRILHIPRNVGKEQQTTILMNYQYNNSK